MPRVKCPHCGAGNQDVTEQDTCWQCGKVLGAPVEREEATPSASAHTEDAPTQVLSPELYRKTPNAPPPPGSSQRTLSAALIIAVLVIAALMILLLALMTKR